MKKKPLNKTTKPTFRHERKFWKKNTKYIAGLDEVGRGAFAGPLVAAAVIFPLGFKPDFEINDSKLIPENKRELISRMIKKTALFYSTGTVNIDFINKHGIAKANQYAFYKAVKKLKIKPNHILVDGFEIKHIKNIYQTAIVHGDRLSTSIAAASIVAKVHRDNIMVKLHKKHPKYSFLTNKGYGTKYHREAIKLNGLCKQHRKTFNLKKYL